MSKIVGDPNVNFDFQIGDRIGRYIVTSHLGKGTFGQVYAVTTTTRKCEYALKVSSVKTITGVRSSGMTPDMRRELDLLKALKKLLKDEKPEIKYRFPSLNDMFVVKGRHCLRMELLGVSMRYIQRRNRHAFHITTVRTILKYVLSALEFLHRNHILHGDLKPENIVFDTSNTHLVTKNGQTWVEPVNLNCRLIDYGSSRILKDKTQLQFEKQLEGTYPYLAPEVLFQSGHSLPIDIWAFACVLFELHTGFPLFQHTDEFEHIFLLYRLFGNVDDDAVVNCRNAKLIDNRNNVLGWKAPDFVAINSHYRNRFNWMAACVRSGGPFERALIHVLVNCFVRLPEIRPTAAQLFEEPFFAEDFASCRKPEKMEVIGV